MADMTVAAGTLITGATTGTAVVTALSLVGMDVPSMVAAMLGCVVVQTLLPAERVNARAIVATTIGSMLFASFAAPFVVPILAKVAPSGIPPEHLKACAAAVVALFPKPLLLLIQRQWAKITGVQDAV